MNNITKVKLLIIILISIVTIILGSIYLNKNENYENLLNFLGVETIFEVGLFLKWIKEKMEESNYEKVYDNENKVYNEIFKNLEKPSFMQSSEDYDTEYKKYHEIIRKFLNIKNEDKNINDEIVKDFINYLHNTLIKIHESVQPMESTTFDNRFIIYIFQYILEKKYNIKIDFINSIKNHFKLMDLTARYIRENITTDSSTINKIMSVLNIIKQLYTKNI